MKLLNMLPYRRNMVIWLALGSIQLAAATQTYCSTQNTGSSYSAVTNIYQSNGACTDQCSSSYAFAVVQWQQCWCSNYIPASQASLSDCSQNCPGYPQEQCGDANSGYFGYIKLDRAASGTAGAASSSTSTIQSQIPSTTTTPSSTPSTTSTSSSTSHSSSTPPTTTTTTTSSVVPVTSLVLTTISGDVVTQTVTTTPMATVDPYPHSDKMQLQRKDGLGGGAIAGVVIGVLAGLALLALAGFLLWRRKRNNDDAENNGTTDKKKPSRNVSVLSKAGLLARARPSMGERDTDDHFHVNPTTGANSVRHSMLFSGADGVSPVSPLDSNDTRRGSQPMVYDQRLNPSVLFANQEANGSRISMQDQQDYSRPLGVVNPDPRESFDSRMGRA
ncbi:Cell wall integrity and stress response component 4 [Lecanosticta acicola]|uniref:Cell wall integrity and stress response component 4 n=1 Tax=Lecanosticta acicola TaxID=111012 RepID=A0AAI8Z1S8_9PEZI|nr:Cell wall integrity and stress response component 4 [Lecanosticta acicola]